MYVSMIFNESIEYISCDLTLKHVWLLMLLHHKEQGDKHPDSKVRGANMGPTGSCRPQVGPM